MERTLCSQPNNLNPRRRQRAERVSSAQPSLATSRSAKIIKNKSTKKIKDSKKHEGHQKQEHEKKSKRAKSLTTRSIGGKRVVWCDTDVADISVPFKAELAKLTPQKYLCSFETPQKYPKGLRRPGAQP